MLLINKETHSYASYAECRAVVLDIDTSTLTFFDENEKEIFHDPYTKLSNALKELISIKENNANIDISISFDDEVYDMSLLED